MTIEQMELFYKAGSIVDAQFIDNVSIAGARLLADEQHTGQIEQGIDMMRNRLTLDLMKKK